MQGINTMKTLDLTDTPEYILRYFSPMMGLGEPYREELIRRRQVEASEENKRRQIKGDAHA